MVVDPTWDAELESVIAHFLSDLPSTIPIYWLTDKPQAKEARDPRLNTCIIRDSDGGPFVLTKSSYNQLRLAPSFWRALPAEWILFFERDSVLCGRGGGGSRPPPPLTFFIEQGFDYIGAPWSHSSSGRIRINTRDAGSNFWCPMAGAPSNCCCNSGLSLVRTPRMAEALEAMNSAGIRGYDLWHAKTNDIYLMFANERLSRSSSSRGGGGGGGEGGGGGR